MNRGKRPTKVKKYHVSSNDREFFTSNLALLLKAAIPVGEVLQSLQETSSSRNMRGALGQMQRDIEAGFSLWKAMERSGIVSGQTLALIHLGEESGNLVENLKLAGQQEKKQHMFRAKIRSALMYPTFVLGMTGTVGLGVSWFLLPRLAETFAGLHVKLPLISRLLVGFGIFLKHDGFWAVPAAVGAILTVGYILFGAPKTRVIGQRLLFHIPGVGALLKEVEIARLGYLLGTLLNAGLTVTESLDLLCEATSAPPYKKFYTYLGQSFDNGYSFAYSLPKYKHSAKILPLPIQQMIIAGERSGVLPETLDSIGDVYTEKSDITIQNLETVLEPILLVFVAAGVMTIAISVILPVYSLIGGLKP